jgi:DNA-binding XRE family transcriptional regulator
MIKLFSFFGLKKHTIKVRENYFRDLGEFQALTNAELAEVRGGSLADNIRAGRIALGWTQEDLAHHLFVTKQAVHNYETGIRTPDLGMLITLATIFHTTLDELVK